MTATALDPQGAALSALMAAADDFARRALAQETHRDRASPGTARHHQHAHSATLWRMAERELRTRIRALESPSGA